MNLKDREKKVNEGVKEKVITHLSGKGEKRVRTGLSSGSLRLNDALSGTPNIGYEWGRTVELYGPEMSGKTTLALHAVHEAQKLKLPCIYIDAEHTCDPKYMESIGINLEELSFVQPDYGEQSLNVVIQSVLAGYKLIVVDSVAALIPKSELEGDVGDARMGVMARMMGQGLRKMCGIVYKHKAIVIFINQIRMKIGVMFGNPETTTGGVALKFFASYRIEVRSPRSGKIEDKDLAKDESEIGTKVLVNIVKNKVYSPHKRTEFVIIYGKGIDKIRDFVDYLDMKRLLTKDGRGTPCLFYNGKTYTKKQLMEKMTISEFRKGLIKSLKGKLK